MATCKMTMERLDELFPFEHHYVNIGTIKIHYIDEGKGPVVVLFHACPMWSFAYRNLIKSLSKKYRVIAPDLPGFGLSDKFRDFDYTLNSYIAVLEIFLKKLNPGNMNFILHGWGGTIALGYAINHPKEIKSLIILNSIAFSGYHLPLRLFLCRLPWIGQKFLFLFNMLESGISRLSPEIRAAYQFPYQTKESEYPRYRFTQVLPYVPEAETTQTIISIEYGLWILREKPVCIIWAMKDWLYPPKLLKKWRKVLPNAEIHMIPDAGRYFQEDAQEELDRHIWNFLTEIENKNMTEVLTDKL